MSDSDDGRGGRGGLDGHGERAVHAGCTDHAGHTARTKRTEHAGHDEGPRTFDRLSATFRSGRTKPLRWRRAQLDALERMLRDHANDLAQAVHADFGKPTAETMLMEIKLVLDEIRFVRPRMARWSARRPKLMPWLLQPARSWTVAEPKGVALVISPWNYPVLLSLEPMVDAIAAGDCVCLKPSELSPATSRVMADLIARYLDPHAFAVVEGGADVTGALLEQPFDHIFYTGGGRVGRIVMTAAAKHLTPVTLELGGKSPVFVDGTADLDAAARRIAWGRFVNAGQTCVAPDYVLATPDIADDLARRIARAARFMFGDGVPAFDPTDQTGDRRANVSNESQISERNIDRADSRIARRPSASYARIVSKRHYDRLMSLMPRGNDPRSAAHVVCGGFGDRSQRYIAPTVLTHVSPDAPVMREEIFGPILPVIEIANAASAVAFVNARPKPLACYVFSHNPAVRRLFERETSSGALGFNLPLGHLLSNRLPFGGVGASGMGSYHGHAGFLEFSHVKTVTAKPTFPDTLAFIYPPYTKGKRSLIDLLSRLP
ncbi:aldehyde dehydrogenase family protein [Bifidobacterium amazonense]|uniref:Aldehyde dehydrogenase n=1 Tax=Bifidobacterium amazonense TaxID=2809027 RepID=A0ABS9VWF4_9BIFI|nr:aldehyde dehydrogenase family protein [Bifidobacterium amazonense]MCH9276447.1 aldehyde dehydrogenase family protein [Bifidobacterium amazonense]